MEAGLMRHRISIQALGSLRNSLGEPEDVWTELCSLRASIQPVSGREFLAADQLHSELTHKITIRYRAGIKPSMRVVYGSRRFDILHIIDTWEQHRVLTLCCREVVE